MKRFKRERFSVYKSGRLAEQRGRFFEMFCRREIDGELVLANDVFFLNGEEFFRPGKGTRCEWMMWHQLYEEIGNPVCALLYSRKDRSKKDWGYGSKSNWKSSSRRKGGLTCHTAGLRREAIARDRAEKASRQP